MNVESFKAELVALQKELKEKEELINKAEQLYNQGSWKWDIKKDIWTFSENWHHVHGVDHLSVNKETLMELAHPDDIPLINEAIRKAIEEKVPYQIEHRIIRKKDGEVRWVKVDGKVSFDENGIEFYHPDDREMVKKAVNDAINQGSPFEFEARIITAKGNQKWV